MSSSIPMAQLSQDTSTTFSGMTSQNLNRRQKAAIIVRFLLNEGAEVELKELSDSQQTDLTHMIGEMGYIDRDTLGDVLMEFAHELESIGLSFPNGISGALNVLEGRISPLTEARLRKEAGVRMVGQPWLRIQKLKVADLVKMIESESTEVAAVLVSKLDVDKAAQLLASLPGDKARRITYAMSMTDSITPEAVDSIGLTLACQLDDKPPRAFSQAPVDRVGAILNNSTTANREEILNSLDQTDAEFAVQVRKTIFTYAHISTRIKNLEIPRLVREIDEATLITALTFGSEGAFGESSEFILNNMSSRMADQLREGVEDRGKVRLKDAEEAMSDITKAVRELEAAGEITLNSLDDDDE